MEFGKEYIKTFDTEAQYLAFKASRGYNEPNVSYVSGDSIVHYNPYVDPCKSEIVKTTYELVDLGLPSGTKWANKNIGALAVTDYGQKFSWGDIQGFTHDQVSGACHSKAFTWEDYKYWTADTGSGSSGMTKYNSTDNKTVLDAEDDAAVANMGGSWRMPTETEFNELLNTSNCTKAWTTNYNGTGINGYLFTSVRNSNTLFFPAAGRCYNGSVNYVGSDGYYWSSSLDTSNEANGRRLSFRSYNCSMGGYNRYHGFSVRGVVGQ